MPLEFDDPDGDGVLRPAPNRFGDRLGKPRSPWWRPASTVGRVFLLAAALLVLGGFTTVDAAASLLFGPRWTARLYVNNLTNIPGVSVAGPVLKNADVAANYREEYVIRPRTIGLALSFRFE